MGLIQVGFANFRDKDIVIEINIPLESSIELYGSKTEQTREKAPDFQLYYKKSPVGGLWKKEKTQDGTEKIYFSGNFITKTGKQNFTIFPKESNGKNYFVVTIPDGEEKDSNIPF